MTKNRKLTILAIVAIPLLAIGWWLGSPLLFTKEVNEDFPLSAAAEVPDDMTQAEVEKEMSDVAEGPDTETDESMPVGQEPEVVVAGTFKDFDTFHKGSGRATIYQLDNGSHVLRLEAFDVTNGPDLHVLLVPDRSPETRDDVEGYVDLGSLKGNVGNQNYALPSDLDPTQFGSVVIYCEPFHVIFSVATLN